MDLEFLRYTPTREIFPFISACLKVDLLKYLIHQLIIHYTEVLVRSAVTLQNNSLSRNKCDRDSKYAAAPARLEWLDARCTDLAVHPHQSTSILPLSMRRQYLPLFVASYPRQSWSAGLRSKSPSRLLHQASCPGSTNTGWTRCRTGGRKADE